MASKGKSEETQFTDVTDIVEKPKTETEVNENKKNDSEIVEEKVEERKNIEAESRDIVLPSVTVEKSSSSSEASSFFSDLRKQEKKVLAKLRSKVDEAIYGKEAAENKRSEIERRNSNISSSAEVDKNSSFREESNFFSDLNEHEKKALAELRPKVEEAIHGHKLFKKKKDKMEEQGAVAKSSESEEDVEKENINVVKKPEKEEEKEEKNDGEEKENTNVALWGVPLSPSKGDDGTDVILLKFLRAREFNANDAFEMLRKTLQWRKENNIDSILNEEFDADFGSIGYMNGVDRQGHPLCYNNFGLLGNDETYEKILGTEEKRDKFLRWRVQMMEKGIQKLDFKPGGVSTLVQISNLKDIPGPSKDVRQASKQLVGLFQDNYPEFVVKNIFINVPFWFYAVSTILSPFLTQRTRSKIVVARPSKVSETLLKYIAAEQVPIEFGGLKQEKDSEFSTEDAVMNVVVKAGSTENIVIPVSEAGTTIIWDLIVLGWEVSYKEEFVPSNDKSYAIIVRRGKTIGAREGSVRNSFKNNEPGKLVFTIENGSFKKKRVLYRYKTKNSSPSS